MSTPSECDLALFHTAANHLDDAAQHRQHAETCLVQIMTNTTDERSRELAMAILERLGQEVPLGSESVRPPSHGGYPQFHVPVRPPLGVEKL